MHKVTILNIPNYYSSFYLLGLERIANLRYNPRKEFAHLNGKPFLVIEYKGKIAVIENDDPIGVDMSAYSDSDLYFATNKLLDREDYSLKKVTPLFPHYSIDNSFAYLKLFGFKGMGALGAKEFLRQFYILFRRPILTNKPFEHLEGNYVFFSGSIWKKENWANQMRAEFVTACKSNPYIEFEGGMNPRTDGDLCGLPPSVMDKRYTPKDFSEKSSKSIIGFSNPAVLDAVSWRLGEYWNYGCFVISFPFKIEIPTIPIHGNHIHYIEGPEEFSDVLTFAMKNPDYREKVAKGGKTYFQENCLPEIQAKRIFDLLENS
ncbi:glycosyltransferase [Algoriphagus sp.]|uniref:glycosyltransferase n=1 Tax=Algoriphagus sp. TaxID=1872435 RepID=UPI0025CF84C8|nr:glycosyltransferase [Algoriphagus sp.]